MMLPEWYLGRYTWFADITFRATGRATYPAGLFEVTWPERTLSIAVGVNTVTLDVKFR